MHIESNSEVIKQFCERWQVDREPFLRSLFTTIYLHDIGKLTKQFQENIRAGTTSLRSPHAFYALFILNEVDYPSLLEIPMEKALILGHHTQLHSQLYDGIEGLTIPAFLESDIVEFVGNSETAYADLGFDKWFSFTGLSIDSISESSNFWGLLTEYRSDVIRETDSFENKEKLKSIFSYMFSILQTCDDYSSVEFSEFTKRYTGSDSQFDSIMEEPARYVPQLCVDNVYKRILGGRNPYDYQKNEQGKLCGDVPFYGLLFAPCGRGKTETALIWALKAMKKYKRNKIVFAMPTQITSNALWERFCELFGEGNSKKEKTESGKKVVGLFHGKSYLKLKEEEKGRKEEDEEDLTTEDLEEIRGENFKGNVFFKPITVTTIDHLILSFVHGFPQADFGLGNLQNAVIVFDEVHYYEKNLNDHNKSTLDHLATLFQILRKMKIPNLLMSGTLPEFFIEDIKRINPEYEGPFIDTEGIYFEPFKFSVSEENLVTRERANSEVVDEIVDNYHKGLVQFVILNTVERSKLVYKALIGRLPQEEVKGRIILHHSQFVYKDRSEKEKEILKKLKEDRIRPFILVATQTIEISLDISCDIMYSELAPGDAIGQRGGRLNRKGQTWISDGCEHLMKVYMPEELGDDTSRKRPYEVDLLKKTANAIENGPCSYRMLKSMCDSIYVDYKLIVPTNLRNIFKECCIFGYRPFDINFGEEECGRLLQIRGEEVQDIEVIPWSYYGEDENKLTVENQARVPIWWLKRDGREPGKLELFVQVTKKKGRKVESYWVSEIPYSKELGFDYRALLDCP